MGEAGVKAFVALAAGLCLASCAAPPAPPPRPAPRAFTPPPPPVRAAPAPRPSADQCGADDLQGLVGRSRTEIPIPLEPGMRRVVCTTCPMTDDWRPERQTILFDPATGLITSVKCG
jgi:hypothetical protein